VKVVGGKVIDRFSELINPGRSVPQRITGLTGISTTMVFDRPPERDVLPAYLDFLGDGVLVAHNLTFDQGFLNAGFERIGQMPLPNPCLCTLRLARRLLRGLRSKSLGSVADFYGIKSVARHRAFGDAEITAQVLQRFLSQLTFDPGLETLNELLAYQHRRYAHIRKEPKRLKHIREEILPTIPSRPGVYFMKDARGEIIYIGKAKILSNRVRQYFTSVEAHASHIRQMVNQVRTIEWEETGSELEALLTESRLIKERQPRFNRADRRYGRRPFIRLSVEEAYPRVSIRNFLTNDGAEYFGPVSGPGKGRLIVDLINRYFMLRECDDHTFARGHACIYAAMNRCLAPCEGGEAAKSYPSEVDRVKAFLAGKDRSVLERLAENMTVASSSLEFEQAANFRDELEILTHLLDKQKNVATAVLDHHVVQVLPGLKPGSVQVYFIRFGRHVGSLNLSVPLGIEQLDHLRKELIVHFNRDTPRPDRYLKEEVDEIRILAHWLFANRDDARQVCWYPDLQPETFFDEVYALIADPVVQS